MGLKEKKKGKKSYNSRPCKRPLSSTIIIDPSAASSSSSPVLVPEPERGEWLDFMAKKIKIDVTLLMKKTLTGTDLSDRHNRLLLRNEDLTHVLPYLTESEMKEVLWEKGKGLEIKVMDTFCNEHVMNFKYWSSNNGYVFNGPGWKSFLLGNKHVKEGDVLPLYAFRRPKDELFMSMPIQTPDQKNGIKKSKEELEFERLVLYNFASALQRENMQRLQEN